MEFLGLDMLNAIVEENGVPDPNVRSLSVLQNVISSFVVVAIYLTFCLKCGPWMTEKRKSFELKNMKIIYYVVGVVLSVWMTYEALASSWGSDNSDSPKEIRMARLSYVYFVCKLVELLDTVIFVLRRKDNQVTFLHLYHQSAVLVLAFYTAKLAPVPRKSISDNTAAIFICHLFLVLMMITLT